MTVPYEAVLDEVPDEVPDDARVGCLPGCLSPEQPHATDCWGLNEEQLRTGVNPTPEPEAKPETPAEPTTATVPLSVMNDVIAVLMTLPAAQVFDLLTNLRARTVLL